MQLLRLSRAKNVARTPSEMGDFVPVRRDLEVLGRRALLLRRVFEHFSRLEKGSQALVAAERGIVYQFLSNCFAWSQTLLGLSFESEHRV